MGKIINGVASVLTYSTSYSWGARQLLSPGTHVPGYTTAVGERKLGTGGKLPPTSFYVYTKFTISQTAQTSADRHIKTIQVVALHHRVEATPTTIAQLTAGVEKLRKFCRC